MRKLQALRVYYLELRFDQRAMKISGQLYCGELGFRLLCNTFSIFCFIFLSSSFIIIILRNYSNNLNFFSFKYSRLVVLKLAQCKDPEAPRQSNHDSRQTYFSLSKFVFVGSFLMLAAVRITVFIVELGMVTVALRKLVRNTPTACFHLANALGCWAPVGIVLRLQILIISRSLCKDTVRSTLAVACLLGVSYRILWQLVGTRGWAARRSLGAVGVLRLQ